MYNLYIEAQPRWSEEEKEYAKQFFMEQRDLEVPHNIIYEKLAKYFTKKTKIVRTPRATKQLIEKLYQFDDDLREYKFESWNREKIIEQLKELYEANETLNRSSLPKKLEFQIENHSLPKAERRGFEVYFQSFDDALAEAILDIGIDRDTGESIQDLEQAKRIYRRRYKKGHAWTKSEILELFREADAEGLPLTVPFFARYPEIYKPLLNVNRSLEGLKFSVLRYFNSWGDAIVAAGIVTEGFYDEQGKAQYSTGEIRVKKFLTNNNIPFRQCGVGDKVPVEDKELREKGYKNFIPDFYILDEEGRDRDVALVEVFGEIADSSAGSRMGDESAGDLYREKMEAKEKVYSKLPIDFIAINCNSDAVDLSEESLRSKFSKFLNEEVLEPELELAAFRDLEIKRYARQWALKAIMKGE